MAEVQTNRVPRDTTKSESSLRATKWMPPALLPDPAPEPGFVFRWIRTSVLDKMDPTNISSKMREGWEPVKASDHPEIQVMGNAQNSRFPDSVEIGGLMLCKIPAEFMEQREAYYREVTETQINSVDNSFMKNNDPRMPLFKERESKVSFGRGS